MVDDEYSDDAICPMCKAILTGDVDGDAKRMEMYCGCCGTWLGIAIGSRSIYKVALAHRPEQDHSKDGVDR